MIEKFSHIKWVGFDLDGTLYQPTPEVQTEINDRIRNKIAEKILEKKVSLKSIQSARDYFEKQFAELSSGSKVLKGIGYENASEIMNYCQENADILDLIQPNIELSQIMAKLKDKYKLFLLTSSPKKIAISKLEKIGIDPNLFTIRIYNDTIGCGSKLEGHAYEFLLTKTNDEANMHLYVGDTLRKDILPARSKGMHTLAVGSTIREADYSIQNINEIAEVLL